MFKIPKRAGVASIPLADLLKAHLGVEVDPQDGKSSRVCNSACNESHDQQRFNRFVCVVSPQRIVKKVVQPTVRHLLQSSPKRRKTAVCRLAKRPLIFNRFEPVPSTVSTRTETNFTLNVLLEDASGDEDVCILLGLQADKTNDKNQNIPHDLHNFTRQPYPLLELAVKDTSVMQSTLQNYYCLIDQRGVAVAGATGLLIASCYSPPIFFASPPSLY